MGWIQSEVCAEVDKLERRGYAIAECVVCDNRIWGVVVGG